MDISVLGILLSLIEQACLVVIIFVLLFHIGFFKRMLAGRFTVGGQVALSLIFGALAIAGTYSGVTTSGAIANIRNLSPMIGGLLAGPWVGLASGAIGGLHRYFMGGFTCVPCGVGTLLSGLAGGIMLVWWQGKIGLWKPVLFAFIMECVDMALLLAFARPFENAVKLVSVIALPMIVADTVGVAIFALLLRDMKSTTKP